VLVVEDGISVSGRQVMEPRASFEADLSFTEGGVRVEEIALIASGLV
jgi:hypothetical protein